MERLLSSVAEDHAYERYNEELEEELPETENVKEKIEMFSYCTKLEKITIGNKFKF